MDRASIEAVLELSAAQVAGPPQQGRARLTHLLWHGRPPGRVCLKERQLKIEPATIAKQGARHQQRSPRPCLSGHAAQQRHGRAHSGNPDGRYVHAALQQSHSGHGRYRGRVAIDCEPGTHRGF